MAAFPAPPRRLPGEVVIWWTVLILMVLGSAPVLLVTLSPDLNRPLQLKSLTHLEQETGLTFPPGTQLLLSRIVLLPDILAVVKLGMPAEAALALIQSPPFDGKTTETERLVTDRDIGYTGGSDPQWHPDSARRCLCATAEDEPNNYWHMRVLVDLDHPPEAVVYLYWGAG